MRFGINLMAWSGALGPAELARGRDIVAGGGTMRAVRLARGGCRELDRGRRFP